MTTESTYQAASSTAIDDDRRCRVLPGHVIGKIAILFEPGSLRVRVERAGETDLLLRLPGSTLERALLFDGQLASVHYDETWFDGMVVDRTVRIVNSGTPFDGKQFVEALNNLFDSEEEKEAWLEQVDHFWPHFEDE